MKKYNLVPALLIIYLGFMCYLGYPQFANGTYSPLRYFGVIALTLACIVAVRIVLKRRYDKTHNDNCN